MRLLSKLLLTMLSCWLPSAVPAEIIPSLATPTSAHSRQPLLTITAKGRNVTLKLSDIERLPMHQTTLQTPWGMSGTFQGVLMSELLAAYPLDKNAKRIVFHTLDGYVAGLSKGEFESSPALLATRFNGQPISPDNKGPLILLWPNKAEAVRQGRATASSWVWSITKISSQ